MTDKAGKVGTKVRFIKTIKVELVTTIEFKPLEEMS